MTTDPNAIVDALLGEFADLAALVGRIEATHEVTIRDLDAQVGIRQNAAADAMIDAALAGTLLRTPEGAAAFTASGDWLYETINERLVKRDLAVWRDDRPGGYWRFSPEAVRAWDVIEAQYPERFPPDDA